MPLGCMFDMNGSLLQPTNRIGSVQIMMAATADNKTVIIKMSMTNLQITNLSLHVPKLLRRCHFILNRPCSVADCI